MNNITINIENGKADIYTPYNIEFVKAIKNIGGAKWNSVKRCWSIPEEAIDAARVVMSEVYGCTDRQATDTVSIRIKAKCNLIGHKNDVLFLGKTLSHASGRDSGARAGTDVFYASGKPYSAGSAKNWVSVVEGESIIDLANVSKAKYQKYLETPNPDIEIIFVKDNAIDRKALIEERENLLKRVKEIDLILDIKNN